MKKIFYLLYFMLLSGCFSRNCDTLPNSFKSVENALALVENINFNFKESIDTSKSSWIGGLSFYS